MHEFITTAIMLFIIIAIALRSQAGHARRALPKTALQYAANRNAYLLALDGLESGLHPRAIKSMVRLSLLNHFGIRGTEASTIYKHAWHDACLVHAVRETTSTAR